MEKLQCILDRIEFEEFGPTYPITFDMESPSLRIHSYPVVTLHVRRIVGIMQEEGKSEVVLESFRVNPRKMAASYAEEARMAGYDAYLATAAEPESLDDDEHRWDVEFAIEQHQRCSGRAVTWRVVHWLCSFGYMREVEALKDSLSRFFSTEAELWANQESEVLTMTKGKKIYASVEAKLKAGEKVKEKAILATSEEMGESFENVRRLYYYYQRRFYIPKVKGSETRLGGSV